MIIFGWLTPWLSAGDILSRILPFFNRGIDWLPDIQVGVGNGLQLSLLFLLGGVAAFSSGGGWIILGLILFVMVGVIITIPILGGLSIRDGIKIFELRLTEDFSKTRHSIISTAIQSMKKRATTIFVIMLVIFIIAAIFPGGTALLGGGYYLVVLTVVATYLIALYIRSKLR